jgi:hypothetical protein
MGQRKGKALNEVKVSKEKKSKEIENKLAFVLNEPIFDWIGRTVK